MAFSQGIDNEKSRKRRIPQRNKIANPIKWGQTPFFKINKLNPV
jgi:hypothetical protein